jgi:hypothetical protein
MISHKDYHKDDEYGLWSVLALEKCYLDSKSYYDTMSYHISTYPNYTSVYAQYCVVSVINIRGTYKYVVAYLEKRQNNNIGLDYMICYSKDPIEVDDEMIKEEKEKEKARIAKNIVEKQKELKELEASIVKNQKELKELETSLDKFYIGKV